MTVMRRWRELSGAQRSVLLRMTAVATMYRIALLVVPWRLVARHRPRVRTRRPASDSAELLRWAAAACRRRVPLQTCLSTALATRELLARAGVPAEIELGVLDRDGTASFHAAVVAQGIRFDADEPMTVLATLGNRE